MLFYISHPGRGTTDQLLRDLAAKLEDRGVRLAGAVQINEEYCESPRARMDLRILGSDTDVRISQDLGPQATGCRLDASGLEDAAHAVHKTLDNGPQMLIINKFGKQEREGKGFRDTIAEAISSDIPTILGVSPTLVPDFLEFADGLASPLPTDADDLLTSALEIAGFDNA